MEKNESFFFSSGKRSSVPSMYYGVSYRSYKKSSYIIPTIYSHLETEFLFLKNSLLGRASWAYVQGPKEIGAQFFVVCIPYNSS